MMRGVGSDIKAGTTVLGNVTKKGATKGINLTNSYLNKMTKAMASQPKKLVVANAGAAGLVEFSSEASDYIVGNKEPTKDNFVKSGIKIGKSAGAAGVTTGMPLGSSIVVNMAINKVAEGDYKTGETVRNTVTGEYIDSLSGGKYAPYIRESLIKITDKMMEKTNDNK